MFEASVFNFTTVQPGISFKECDLNYLEMGISNCFAFSADAVFPESSFILYPDVCKILLFEFLDNSFTIYCIGSQIHQFSFPLKSGAEYFGVRILPGMNSLTGFLDAKSLINSYAQITDNSFLELLGKKLMDASSLNSRYHIFLKEFMLVNNKEFSSQITLFYQIMDLIYRKKGILKISELEVLTGYSARYINHIFEKQAGISAKQVSNIIKIDNIINDLYHGTVKSFSKLASDYHFYDQAHFIHEFKAFTGMTPSEYNTQITKKLA